MNGRIGTIYDNEAVFISAVHDKLNDLRTTNGSAVPPEGSKLNEKAVGAKYGLWGALTIRSSVEAVKLPRFAGRYGSNPRPFLARVAGLSSPSATIPSPRSQCPASPKSRVPVRKGSRRSWLRCPY